MERRADPGVGIEGVNQAQHPGEEILPGEDLRPQVLAAGEEDVAGHGNHLGDEDVKVQLPEPLHVIEEIVQKTSEHQHVPAHIENQEKLIKWDDIV